MSTRPGAAVRTHSAGGRWWLYNEEAGSESVELRGPDFMLTVFDLDRLIADLDEARRFLIRERLRRSEGGAA